MEQPKHSVICALKAATLPQPKLSHPSKLGNLTYVPRKKRSLRQERHDGNVDSGPNKRRRLMFNETDMTEVKFRVNFNRWCTNIRQEKNARNKGFRKNEKQVSSVQCSFPLRQIVAPQTPSPIKGKKARGSPSLGKRKRARGSINVKLGNLTSSAMRKENISEKAQNAHYYTRFLNKLVLSELFHEQGICNQPSADTNTDHHPKSVGQLQKVIASSSQKKRLKKVQPPPGFESVIRAWKGLLSKGNVESSDTILNKFHGVCPEVSFIHKVGSIQGSRAYFPWKGSVLDSVIGAILSQRVADNFSSSAFMTLGSIFPQHPACDQYSRHHRMLREKRTNSDYRNQILESDAIINSQFIEDNASKLAKTRRKLFDVKNTEPSWRGEIPNKLEWKNLKTNHCEGSVHERNINAVDSVDWYAVMRADVKDISAAISKRGMNKKLARRIKNFLSRLLSEHGNLDLEWLKNLCPVKAKDYLLSIDGFGLKSAECVQLLSLRNPAFPVDVNVARVTVRLGWIPAPPISDKLLMDLIQEDSKVHKRIHHFLWSRLCTFDEDTLYQLHYHMITFGKVFCKRQEPNCSQCPMRSDCKYHQSTVVNRTKHGLSRRALGSHSGNAMKEKTSSPTDRPRPCFQEMDMEDFGRVEAKAALPVSESEKKKYKVKESSNGIFPAEWIQAPSTPVKDHSGRFRRNKHKKSKTSTEVRQINKIRTRTEHLIYELPDWHPILETFDDRDPDDPYPYLLVTWNSGHHEVKKSGEPFANNLSCGSNGDGSGSGLVPGTIMIPYRTALKGKFPLNGTYFQTNEVFADWQTSESPVDVPCKTLQGAPRKTLFCGTSLTTIVKGLSANEIQSLFREGYICTRGFDRKTNDTKQLENQLHSTPGWKKRHK